MKGERSEARRWRGGLARGEDSSGSWGGWTIDSICTGTFHPICARFEGAVNE